MQTQLDILQVHALLETDRSDSQRHRTAPSSEDASADQWDPDGDGNPGPRVAYPTLLGAQPGAARPGEGEKEKVSAPARSARRELETVQLKVAGLEEQILRLSTEVAAATWRSEQAANARAEAMMSSALAELRQKLEAAAEEEQERSFKALA